jgi:hypothetical protein
VDSRLIRLLGDLQGITDRRDRAKALSDVLGGVPEFQKALRHLRQDLLTELHDEDGLSYGEIAKVVGVSRGRVKQVIDGQTVSGRLLKKPEQQDAPPPAE